MRRNVSLWISLYTAFMIGYFLVLAVVLPSTLSYEPDWIKVGSFAEYSVDDYEYRYTCGGCRARAYNYFKDILAPDPGCVINQEFWNQLQVELKSNQSIR